MTKRRRVKSKEASVENVKKLFSQAPNKDLISIKEAFKAWGRDDSVDIEKNKAWLSNFLYSLKYHNLIRPIYTMEDGRKKLNKLELTLTGKKLLGRIDGGSEEKGFEEGGKDYTLTDVLKIIAKLRKDNPEYDIKFDMKLKDDDKG